MPPSYKELKESFVSGHTGSTVADVNLVTSIAPIAYILWSVLQKRHSFFARYDVPVFLADSLLHVGAILLVITIYANIATTFAIILLSVAATVYAIPVKRQTVKKPPPKKTEQKRDEKLDELPIRPFVTAYRGGMMIITCLAILAVDFKVFPRRFAKVETWGTSLMDMGVGSFVFAAGLVSARPILKEHYQDDKSSILQQLKASVRVSLPLMALGFVRLYSVKKVDYAEHVSEYGIHWNFFFTLGLLPPFVALCQPLPSAVRCYLLPFGLIATYQVLLENTNLKAYILTAPRVDLLSQNKEGVFSFIGYLVIFLQGQGIGLQVLPRTPWSADSTSTPWQRRKFLLGYLLAIHAMYWANYLFSTDVRYGLAIHPSRRLGNEPYVSWVILYNTGQLFFYCIIETLLFPAVYAATDKQAEKKHVQAATSKILNAFNRNGLAIFLLANLMTGLVNLSMDTLHMGTAVSMAVLATYAFTLTAVAVTLDVYNISIKL